MMGWLSRLRRYRVPEEELRHSDRALKQSETLKDLARNIRVEAEVVGAEQRSLQLNNHFGQSLTHVYRKT